MQTIRGRVGSEWRFNKFYTDYKSRPLQGGLAPTISRASRQARVGIKAHLAYEKVELKHKSGLDSCADQANTGSKWSITRRHDKSWHDINVEATMLGRH